jgi:malonate transporter
MGGVFAGFATIAIVIGVGMALAHVGLVDLSGQRLLAALTFNVASPALLLTLLADRDFAGIFSSNLVVTAGAVAVTAGVAFAVALARRLSLGVTVISVLGSCYANAANLGLPIAAYALGDASAVVPTLLLQLVVLQPLALTLLDVSTGTARLSLARVLSRPLRNPMTVGTVAGLALSATGAELPAFLADPLALLAGMAVPAMLIAYGASLRLGPLPGRGVPAAELGLAVGLKMVAQPLAAYLIGRLLLGLHHHDLLAVTVIAGLPTAQNVFVMATYYRQGATLARDVVFVSTLASVPVVVSILFLLG